MSDGVMVLNSSNLHPSSTWDLMQRVDHVLPGQEGICLYPLTQHILDVGQQGKQVPNQLQDVGVVCVCLVLQTHLLLSILHLITSVSSLWRLSVCLQFSSQEVSVDLKTKLSKSLVPIPSHIILFRKFTVEIIFISFIFELRRSCSSCDDLSGSIVSWLVFTDCSSSTQ